MKRQITFLTDGEPLSDENSRNKELIRELKLNDGFSSRGKSVSFTGLIEAEGIFYVFLPKTFALTAPSDPIKLARLSLWAFKRYYRELPHEQWDSHGLVGSGGVLDTSVALLEDWRRYGEYKRSKKREKLGGRGKVLWKATSRKVEPIHLKSGPIYPELITKASIADHKALIRRIHRWAVRESDVQLGWLLSSSQFVAPELKDVSANLGLSAQQAARFLRLQLSRHFSDRDRNLLRLLVAHIEKKHGPSVSGSRAYGTSRFHHVWEAVCGAVLRNDKASIKPFLPQPKYYGFEKCSSPSQIPDITVEGEDYTLVLDAKYYDTDKNQPGWPDLIKQFLYASTLKAALGRDIGNFLIFPENKERIANPLELPYVVLENEERRFDDYGKVYCIHVSIERFLRMYCTNQVDEETRNRLIEIWKTLSEEETQSEDKSESA